MSNYKKAFKCKSCPQSNQEDGCPMWWEIIMTNTEDPTQPPKVEKGCGYQMLPLFLIDATKSALHATDAAYDMRNRVVESVTKFITSQSQSAVRVEEISDAESNSQSTHQLEDR